MALLSAYAVSWYDDVMPAKFKLGHDRKKHMVKRAANIDAIIHSLMVPEQLSLSFFTK
jgi:hypothetical protein